VTEGSWVSFFAVVIGAVGVLSALMLFANFCKWLASLTPTPPPTPVTTKAAEPSKKEQDHTGGVIFLIIILGVGGYGWLTAPPKTTPQVPAYYSPPPQPVWVNGYYRQNGTFVNGHYRTSPDHTDTNNWSTSPNVNPFTGQKGTRSHR